MENITKQIRDFKLIGIGGVANSGKDTVANMIDFVLNAKKPSFEHYVYYMENIYVKEECYNIINFADVLKNILSQLYNIPRKYFDNIEMKDNAYYLFDETKVVDADYLNNVTSDYFIYCINNSMSLSEYINFREGKVAIKLRTLMQYFGTNVIREKMGNTVWIDACVRNVERLLMFNTHVIVSDVRFTNEAKAIKNAGGILIKVRRNPKIEVNHPSEKVNFHADIEINNVGTLEDLFNKVKEIININV